MSYPGLIGRSKSRKEQATCYPSIIEEKRVPEVIPVEQLNCLLLEYPPKDNQKQFLEIKNAKTCIHTARSPTGLLNEGYFAEEKDHIFWHKYPKDILFTLQLL